MRRRKHYFEQSEQEQEVFWPSFTDMMVMVMVMVVLVMLFIAVIAFIQSVYEANDQTEIKKELSQVANVKQEMSDIIESKLAENVGKDKVTRGPNNTISIEGDILFDTASAKISDRGEKILDSVSGAIVEIIENEEMSQYIYIILIEGHTDSVPYDNWTLSTERAISVVQYMMETNPKLSQTDYAQYLAATGYSKYKPVADGDSPADLRKNRRISFQMILDDNKWQNRIRQLVEE